MLIFVLVFVCLFFFFLLFNYILPKWGGGKMLKIDGNLKINFPQVIKENV